MGNDDSDSDDDSSYVEDGTVASDDDDDDDSNHGVFSFMDRVFGRVRSLGRRRQQESREEVSLVDEEGVSQQPLLEHSDGDSQA